MEEYLAGYDGDDAGPSGLRLEHGGTSRRSSTISTGSSGFSGSRGSRRSSNEIIARSPTPSRSRSPRSASPDSLSTNSAVAQPEDGEADQDETSEEPDDNEGKRIFSAMASHAGELSATLSLDRNATSAVVDEDVADELEGDRSLEVYQVRGPADDAHEYDDGSYNYETHDFGETGANHNELNGPGIGEQPRGKRLEADRDTTQCYESPHDASRPRSDSIQLHDARLAPPLSAYKLDLYAHLRSTQTRPLSLAGSFARAGDTCLAPFYRPWTAADRSRFFISLARHSRFRPDLISADVGRSEGEVLGYLETLERGAAVVRRRRERVDRAGFGRGDGCASGLGAANNTREGAEVEFDEARSADAHLTAGNKRKRGGTVKTGEGWRYWREGFAPGAHSVSDEWIDVEEGCAAEIEREVDAERARRWKEDRFRRWSEITVEVKAALERKRAEQQLEAEQVGYTAAEVDAEVQRRVIEEFGRAWNAGREWGDVLDTDKLMVLRRRLMKSRMNVEQAIVVPATPGGQPGSTNRAGHDRAGVSRDEVEGAGGGPSVKVERDATASNRRRPRRRLTDREDELESKARRALVERGRVERRTRRRRIMGDVPLEVLHARGVAFLQRLSERRRARRAGPAGQYGTNAEDDAGGPVGVDNGVEDGVEDGIEDVIGIASRNEDPSADLTASGRLRQPVLGGKLRAIRRNMLVTLRKRIGADGIARWTSDRGVNDAYTRWDGRGPSGRQWVELQLEEIGDKARIERAIRLWAGDEIDTETEPDEEDGDALDDLCDAASDDGLAEEECPEDVNGRCDGRAVPTSRPEVAPDYEVPSRLGRAWPQRRYEWTEYADDAAYEFIRDFPRSLRSEAMREVYKRLRGRIRRRREARMKSLQEEGFEVYAVEAEGGADAVWRSRQSSESGGDATSHADLAQMRRGGRGVSGEEWVEVLVHELGPVGRYGHEPPITARDAYDHAVRKAVEADHAAYDRLVEFFDQNPPGWTVSPETRTIGGKSFEMESEGKAGAKALAKVTRRRAKVEKEVRADLHAAAEMRDLKADVLVGLGEMSHGEIASQGGASACWEERFGKALGRATQRKSRGNVMDDLGDGSDTDYEDYASAEKVALALVDRYIAAQRTPAGPPIDRDPRPEAPSSDDAPPASGAPASQSHSHHASSRRLRMGAPIPLSDSAKADKAAIEYLQGITRGDTTADAVARTKRKTGPAARASRGGRELSEDEKTVLRWLSQRQSVRKRERKRRGVSAGKRAEHDGLWDDLNGAEWVGVLLALLRRAHTTEIAGESQVTQTYTAGNSGRHLGVGANGDDGRRNDTVTAAHSVSSRSAIFFAHLFPYLPAHATQVNDERAAEWLNSQPRAQRSPIEWVVLKLLEHRKRNATGMKGGQGQSGQDVEPFCEQTGEEWAKALLRNLGGGKAVDSIENAQPDRPSNGRVKVFDTGDLPSLEVTDYLDDRAKAFILGINSRRRTPEQEAVLDFVNQRIRRRKKTRMTKLVKEGTSAEAIRKAGGADAVWRAKLVGEDELSAPAQGPPTKGRRATRRRETHAKAHKQTAAEMSNAERWKHRRERARSTQRVRMGVIDFDVREHGTEGREWVKLLERFLREADDGADSVRDESVWDESGGELSAIDSDDEDQRDSDDDDDVASPDDDSNADNHTAGDTATSRLIKHTSVPRSQRQAYDELAIAHLRAKLAPANSSEAIKRRLSDVEEALLARLLRAKKARRADRYSLLRRRFGLSKEEVHRRGGLDAVWAERHPGAEYKADEGEGAMTGQRWVEVLLGEHQASRRSNLTDAREGPGNCDEPEKGGQAFDEAGGSEDVGSAGRRGRARRSDTGVPATNQDRYGMTKWIRLYGRYAVEQLDERSYEYLSSLGKPSIHKADVNDSNVSRRERQNASGTATTVTRRTRDEERLRVQLQKRRNNRQRARRDHLMRTFGLTGAGIDRMGGADAVWRLKYPAPSIDAVGASSSRYRAVAASNGDVLAVPDISGAEWTRMLLAEQSSSRDGGRPSVIMAQTDDSSESEDHGTGSDSAEGSRGRASGSRARMDGADRSATTQTASVAKSHAKGGKQSLNFRTREILDIKAIEFVLARPRHDRTSEQTALVGQIRKAQRASAAWRERVLLDRGWTPEQIRAAGGVTGAWWSRNDATGKRRNGEEIDYEAVKMYGGKEWAEKRMRELGIWSRDANAESTVVSMRLAQQSTDGPQSKKEAMRLGMEENEEGLNGWDLFDMGWFARRLGAQDDDRRTMSGEVLHVLRDELQRFLTPLVAGSIIVAEQRRAQMGLVPAAGAAGVISERRISATSAADDDDTDMDETDNEHVVDGSGHTANGTLVTKPKRRKGAPPDAEIDIEHVRTALALQGRSQRDPSKGTWVDDDHGRRLRAYRYVREGDRWNMDPPRWVGWEVMHLDGGSGAQEHVEGGQGGQGDEDAGVWEIESTQTDWEEEELEEARDRMDKAIDAAEQNSLWTGAERIGHDADGDQAETRPAKRRRTRLASAHSHDSIPAVLEYRRIFARVARARQTRRDAKARQAKSQARWDAKTKTLTRGRYRTKARLVSSEVIDTDDDDDESRKDGDDYGDVDDEDMVRLDGEDDEDHETGIDGEHGNVGDEIDETFVDDIDAE